MYILALYAATVLIWGTTWFAIVLQLGEVSPEVSLVYRFGLAWLALVLFAVVTGRPIRVALKHYPFIAVQGLFMFAMSYLLVYHGTSYISSGLVAVLFTTLVFMNTLNERVFFGTPVQTSVIVSAIMGGSGIALIFWPELRSLDITGPAARGLLLVLAGTFLASLGNMAAIRNTLAGLPVLQVNIHGIGWGTLFLTMAVLVRGEPFIMDWSFTYIASLVYLALPGTAIAFGFYLVLMGKIGSGRAAYVTVLFPVVALVVSTIFEDYQWTVPAGAGVMLTLAGNAVALAGAPK